MQTAPSWQTAAMGWLFFIALAWAEPPTVAIADLANLTGDPALDGAGPGVAGILTARFSQTGAVRVVERSALVSLLDEQRLTVAGLTDPATAIRAGHLLGAEYLVVGQIFSVKLPSISVALRVIDTHTGEVMASEDVIGEVGADGERFFDLVDQLSDEILAAMHVTLPSDERALLSTIERRELQAVLRYGEDLLRVNTANPMALYRRSDVDFSRDRYTRTHWMVYQQDGATVPMPLFSRRIGDEPMNLAYMDRLTKIRHRYARNQWLTVGYGLGAVGLVAFGGRLGDGDGDPETPTATQSAGVAVLTVFPFHLGANALAATAARRSAKYPGTFYTPEDADRWIHAYNESLP